MADGKFVAYFRVSTQKQGMSGLGLEAQQKSVSNYLNGGEWELIGKFTEVETGKGSDALSKRPQLRAALALAKKAKATLIIAKLDRLARNVHFVSGLLESNVDFVCVDMPQANKVMLQMYSVMAEWERDQISARTKAALAAAKERGVVLGSAGKLNISGVNESRVEAAKDFAETLRPTIKAYVDAGMSYRSIVEQMNNVGIATSSGKGRWSVGMLQRVRSNLGI